VFAHKSPARVLSKEIPLAVGVLWVTVKALKNVFFHLIPATSSVVLLSLLVLRLHVNEWFSLPRAAHWDPWASVGTLGLQLILHMGRVNCIKCFCSGPGFSAAPEFLKLLQVPQFCLRLWAYCLRQPKF